MKIKNCPFCGEYYDIKCTNENMLYGLPIKYFRLFNGFYTRYPRNIDILDIFKSFSNNLLGMR